MPEGGPISFTSGSAVAVAEYGRPKLASSASPLLSQLLEYIPNRCKGETRRAFSLDELLCLSKKRYWVGFVLIWIATTSSKQSPHGNRLGEPSYKCCALHTISTFLPS